MVIVVAGLLSHPPPCSSATPAAGCRAVAQLPGHRPLFPAPVAGARVRVVVGYTGSYPDANALHERAQRAGLLDVESAPGRLRASSRLRGRRAVNRDGAGADGGAGLGSESGVELDPDD